MIKRKWLAGLLTGALALVTITGCGSTPAESENDTTAVIDISTEAKKADSADGNESTSGDATKGAADASMKIVTTIFPEYDWVKTMLGDKAENADMTLLLDNGVDLHSYQPTAEDIVKIKECDMFVYVGGESDEWVEDVLASAENEDMVVINLLDVLGDSVKNEEIVEGMEHEHDHEEGDEHEDADHEEGDEHEDADHEEGDEHEDADHEEGDEHEDADHEDEDDEHEDADHEDGEEHEDEDHEDGEEHEHEEEKDEHVWLSLKNASVLCEEIATQLGTIDEANKDYYMSNYEDYKAELDALDEEYQAAVDAGSKDTILFGDRFPFRYLVDDYGLNYYAAFAGCSAESEASFDTVIFLAGKVDELGLPAILTIEGADHDIAETVKKNTKSGDQKILTMNSLQSTTSKDIAEGTTYLSVMRSNLDVLKDALQ